MTWIKNDCKATKAYSEQILESIVDRLGLDKTKYTLNYVYDIYTTGDPNVVEQEIFNGMKVFMKQHNYPQLYTEGARKACENNPFVLGRYWNPKSVCGKCNKEGRLSDGKCMTIYLPPYEKQKGIGLGSTDWKCYNCIEAYVKEINKEWGGSTVINSETGNIVIH